MSSSRIGSCRCRATTVRSTRRQQVRATCKRAANSANQIAATGDEANQLARDQFDWFKAEYDKTAVVVQGHTDSQGSEEHNQALSDRRAGAVRNFLVGRGIDGYRLH